MLTFRACSLLVYIVDQSLISLSLHPLDSIRNLLIFLYNSSPATQPYRKVKSFVECTLYTHSEYAHASGTSLDLSGLASGLVVKSRPLGLHPCGLFLTTRSQALAYKSNVTRGAIIYINYYIPVKPYFKEYCYKCYIAHSVHIYPFDV